MIRLWGGWAEWRSVSLGRDKWRSNWSTLGKKNESCNSLRKETKFKGYLVQCFKIKKWETEFGEA